MLHDATPAAGKRAAFRAGLASGALLRFPGAFNPLSARLIERHGFDGVYVSGAVISADLGLPDIGLTTLTEVAGRAQQIARVTALPALVDADTGFGEPMNAARTVQVLEDAGVAGLHIEDQVNPKRCGHRVYKNGDSRVPTMRAALGQIAELRDGQRLIDIYEVLAKAMFEAKGLHPNLDYPAGLAYHLIGFDTPAFTPIFVAARLPGWTSHIAEQLSGNSLIRPLAVYDGPAERHVAA